MRKKYFLKKRKGFTLIELLVVVGIIAIMSVVVLVSLNSTKSQSRLKAAQREVTTSIKLAQSYALQGKTQNGATPCGYGFKFTDDTNYKIFYNTSSGYTDCEARNKLVAGRQETGSSAAETYSLKDGVKMTSPTSDSSIYFTVPHANAYKNSGIDYTEQTLTFSSSVSGAPTTKTITIKPGGYVTEN